MRKDFITLVESSNQSVHERVYSPSLYFHLLECACNGYDPNLLIKDLRKSDSIFMESLSLESKYNDVLVEGMLDSISKLFSRISSSVQKYISSNKDRIIGWLQGASVTAVAFMIFFSSPTPESLNIEPSVSPEVPSVIEQVKEIQHEVSSESPEDLALDISHKIFNELYSKSGNLNADFETGEALSGNVRQSHKLRKQMMEKVFNAKKEMLRSKQKSYKEVMMSDVDDEVKATAEKAYEDYKGILNAQADILLEMITDVIYQGSLVDRQDKSIGDKIDNSLKDIKKGQ